MPQANSTFEVWSNLTTKAPDFFNDTVASTSRATSADKTRAVDLQSSTSGSTTSSSANVSIPEVSSAKPTAELTPPLVEDFSTSNLTLAVNEPGFNTSSQDKDDKLIDEDYDLVLLDKILGCSPVRYAKFESIRYFIDIDILQNCLIDIDIDIDIFQNHHIDIDIDIDIFEIA